MKLCHNLISRRRGFAVGGAILILTAFLAIGGLCLPGTAAAEAARARDTINGDPVTTLQWSEGTWLQGNSPIPGCTTFPGGISTGPSGWVFADSVVCSPVMNHWKWSVTIPGPFTLQYDIAGIPPGITVCGQVFGANGMSGIRAEVDIPSDWMNCYNIDSGELIWSGRFSKFEAEYAGFELIAAQRCGVYHVFPPGACCNLATGECQILTEPECDQQPYPHQYMGDDTVCEPNPCPQPPGACCHPDGTCTVTLEADCTPPNVWQGPGTVCEPNPCPPVPTDQRRWGTIKAFYR